MIRRVYEEQKKESKTGDFSYLIQEDLAELKIKIVEDEVRGYKQNRLE